MGDKIKLIINKCINDLDALSIANEYERSIVRLTILEKTIDKIIEITDKKDNTLINKIKNILKI